MTTCKNYNTFLICWHKVIVIRSQAGRIDVTSDRYLFNSLVMIFSPVLIFLVKYIYIFRMNKIVANEEFFGP